jgi:GAF domain-containing protein
LVRPSAASGHGRLIATKRVVYIADLRADQAYRDRVPNTVLLVETAGARSYLGVPMLKDDDLIGTIIIYRQEVRPFTDKQIALVQNFAAQAVIAIENARLLSEPRESLQQQTAASEVLGIISRSPGELAPVFEIILANATRICEAKFGMLALREGELFRHVALHGAPPAFAEYRLNKPTIRYDPKMVSVRALAARQVVQVADVAAEGLTHPDRVALVELGGARTLLAAPLFKENELIGVINIYRQEVRPFTDKQIALVQNFAAQAVIAIENARLLNELRQRTIDLTESLEQQTATSEVLRVISSSPGELEPVFQTMLENATRICEAKFGTLYLRDADSFRVAAMHNTPPAYAEARQREPMVRPPPDSILGRVSASKQVVHIDDVREVQSYIERDPFMVAGVDLGGYRTTLGVPMLKQNALIGVVSIYRQEVRPFTDKQIELVKNFAAQAVIAIENARLLNELRQRTSDLTESLEQQTATANVLRVISSSPGELGPVFDAVLDSATRLDITQCPLMTQSGHRSPHVILTR